ncbi:MAG: D-2-hydroxyacid dehydrogenase [Thermoanaerobaculia bacterium]
MEKILVPGHLLDALSEAVMGLDLDLVPYDQNGIPLRNSTGTTAMFRWWLSQDDGDRLLIQNPGIRWLHTGSAGVDHILTPTFELVSPLLTNSRGVHAPSIAEWVVACMLYQLKALNEMSLRQASHTWEKIERPELTDSHVTVLGGGSIACEIARRLRPFGSVITAVRRSARQASEFDRVVGPEGLEKEAHEADWFIIAVPLTPETRGVVDRNVIGAMSPECTLINVARGEIIDQSALRNAIRERRIRGAILDVFEHEPLPSHDPLWDSPGVLVLPHTTWRSPEVKMRQVALFAENTRRFVRGDTLLNLVDVTRGY